MSLSDEDLAEIHRDLHTHPELSFQEERTAQIMADRLGGWGYDVTTGIGGTGVVGILDNGPGPTVLLRADMDGLRWPRRPASTTPARGGPLQAWHGDDRVVDPGTMTGSEDVGVLAESAGVPCAFWFLGGADPALFSDATGIAELLEVVRDPPSNHSPFYSPVIDPTLRLGVEALLTAFKEWAPANAG